MKRLFIQAIFLVSVSQALVIQPRAVQADALTQEKIVALEKLVLITDMLDIAKASVDTQIESLIQTARAVKPGADPRVLKLLRESAREVMVENIDDLGPKIAVIYDELFTYEEILQLIRFYEKPIGKKMTRVMPVFINRVNAIGETWGEDVKRKLKQRLNEKLKAEGIDIEGNEDPDRCTPPRMC